MTSNINLLSRSLYEKDFNLWLLRTIEQLRAGKFDEIDLENLIEEMESMGRSERRALESLLIRLLEHLLKLTYWESERFRCQRGWGKEIRNFRFSIQKILKDSPSLKPYIKEVFNECYQQARLNFIDDSEIEDLPLSVTWTAEQVIDPDWLPLDLNDKN